MSDLLFLEIRAASPHEAAQYATVAAETFVEAYARTAVPSNLAAHVAREFGEVQQRRELEDPAITVLAAREPAGDWAGFVRLHAERLVDCVVAARPIEIVRFYVRGRWHGRGVAQQLMGAALDLATVRGHDAVWLNVWEENARARRFYEKSGFRVAGTKPFLFGEVLEEDVVYTHGLGTAGGATAGAITGRRNEG